MPVARPGRDRSGLALARRTARAVAEDSERLAAPPRVDHALQRHVSAARRRAARRRTEAESLQHRFDAISVARLAHRNPDEAIAVVVGAAEESLVPRRDEERLANSRAGRRLRSRCASVAPSRRRNGANTIPPSHTEKRNSGVRALGGRADLRWPWSGHATRDGSARRRSDHAGLSAPRARRPTTVARAPSRRRRLGRSRQRSAPIATAKSTLIWRVATTYETGAVRSACEDQPVAREADRGGDEGAAPLAARDGARAPRARCGAARAA